MNTKNLVLGAALLGVVAFAGSASAQDTATGTLSVTGTVVSSISLTIDSAGGGSQSGMGTSAATTALGSISKFGGVVPANFTRTITATDWTLSSTVGVTVTKANSISTAYTLNAKLSTAPATGVLWNVNAVLLNATTAQALTAAGVWGSTPTYAWTITIPDALPTASAINNTIMFDAISG
jgi:hypothetical protein